MEEKNTARRKEGIGGEEYSWEEGRDWMRRIQLGVRKGLEEKNTARRKDGDWRRRMKEERKA